MSPEEQNITTTQPKQRALEYRIPPEGMVRVYSNNVSMASTRFDIRLIFGEVADVTDEKAIVENRVQVTMSWIETKVLADFLQANVKAFEELNGPLKLPAIPDKVVVPETFQLIK
jgi:hypothetical protein